MEPHPIADTFPEMSDADLASLAEDIKAKGLVDPIITFEGKILDGRHRFKACRAAGVAPVFQPFEGEDPVAFVVSKNLHRRHLTTAERKKVAAAIVERQPERSNNSIATEVNLSDKTVARVRKVVEANSEIPNKTERVEASGRKARGRKPNEPKQTPVEEPKLAVEEPRAEEQPMVGTTDNLRTWIDLKPALPMTEPITAEIADQCSFLRNLPPLKVPSHVQPIVDALAALTKREDRRVIRCWIKLNWPLPVQGGGAPGEL